AATSQPDPLPRSPERLLRLLRAGGDTDTPASATQTVAAAVTAAGATRQQDEVATQLLNFSQHYWGPCTWAQAGPALICHGEYSYRAPGLYPASDLRLITDAFQNP